MRAGRIADSLVEPWVQDLLDQTTHLGLMLADAFSVADPLTVEPVGGVYTRVAVLWTPTGRVGRNSNALVWVGIPPGTVAVAIAGWTAAFNGAVTFNAPLTPALSFPAGGGHIIDAGDFFVGIDA